MYFSASNIYTFYKPKECSARVYLVHHRLTLEASSPFDEVIKKLGQKQEYAYLAQFPDAFDLQTGSLEERSAKTQKHIEVKDICLYQPVLSYSTPLTLEIGVIQVNFTGIPDFILLDNDQYIIRDVKLASRINDKDHPEILLQLQYYGWLFEKQYGYPPAMLQVYSGANELVEVPFLPEEVLLAELMRIIRYQLFESEPYSPVGWSKCMGCGYKNRCWHDATYNEDPAILVGVDQGLAIVLKNEGLTITSLLDTYDEKALSELRRPWGKSAQKVGKKAGNILQAAKAHLSRSEIWLSTPTLPVGDNFVMFDLEGLPPYVDGTDKVYLWGMQVYGSNPSDYLYSLSDKGEDGDREGWFGFLKQAKQLMEQYPGIKFVHWAIYERVKIQLYIQRFGDPEGTAQKVLENLFDLLVETQKSVIIPLPSYSLKEVEKYIGFKRAQEEYGGEWSIAQYIESVEIENKADRKQFLESVLLYNKEDLAATWAVLEWMKEGPSLEEGLVQRA